MKRTYEQSRERAAERVDEQLRKDVASVEEGLQASESLRDPIPIAASVAMNAPIQCPCNSGKSFAECHGAAQVAPPPVLAPSTQPVKLDLACGQNPREGFAGVDLLAPNAQKVDLLKFPWPWDDASVDELHCSHFAEHIPCREVEERDAAGLSTVLGPRGFVHPGPEAVQPFLGQDMFFAFFDEAWRVLKNDGVMTVIVPVLQSVRAFQDPTHRRFIPQETFLYLNADWRKLQKLDHYRVSCNFAVNVEHSIPSEFGLFAAEVQARKFAECWNIAIDWHAKLVALK